ncbi:hypothetical protein [Aeropyrum pernix]|uniref:hypothetical protein n=1 Tax=Aeropyrum pernix TaxID=56636 RepID=UPI0010381B65|nr:hypothetical protein [Aeropyrum pernix]
MTSVTGVPSLDRLLSPVPSSGWVVEVYGGAARLLAHSAVAEASRRGRVAVVNVQDFGGFDPYLAARLSRMRGGDPGNILFARAFRLHDVASLVLEASSTGAGTVVVVDPFRFAPRTPLAYSLLTRITGALRAAARRSMVFVANRVTQFGRARPEGGHFHHHSVHVIARAEWRGRGVFATLLKHPAKPVPQAALAPEPELGVRLLWAGQRPLEEYL